MTRKLFVGSLLLVAALLLAGPRTVVADEEKEADLKKLEAIVDNALKAYNDEDHKKFFADYSKLIKDAFNEQTFKALYVDGTKKMYGKYKDKTKKIYKPKTVTKGDMPTLVYVAEFEKEPKVMIAINFVTEDGAYKVLQILFMAFKED